MFKNRIFLALIAAILLTSCSDDQDKSGKPAKQSESPSSPQDDFFTYQTAPQITVTDIKNNPVANAQILIGTSLGHPFVNNMLSTNEQGQSLLPSDWTSALPVTIQAPGFVRVTYFDQSPANINIVLHALPSPVLYEVSGTTTGHKIVNKDNWVDFGVVLPALTREDILSFDVSRVISDKMDVIQIVGQDVKIPSNVSLPKQKESYFLPITIDKPDYRIYLDHKGINQIYAIKGRFPFDTVIDAMRNKQEFYDLINYFSIDSAVLREIDVVGLKNSLNLPVTEILLNQSIKVKAPQILSDEVYLAATIAEKNNLLLPTDIKKIEANQSLSLNIMPNANPLLLSLLKKKDQIPKDVTRLSIALTSARANVVAQFLPFIEEGVIDKNTFQADPIMENKAIHVLGTYSALSEVSEKNENGKIKKTYKKVWETYSSQWGSQIQLPVWPDDNILLNKKKWEVAFVGSLEDAADVPTGPQMVLKTTHVSYMSLEK